MEKMWAGRTAGKTSEIADRLNSSIGVDKRLYACDIRGSIAHARMLEKQGIIKGEEADAIVSALTEILEEIESGKLAIDMSAEDIHMFVEAELTKRIGEAGKKVHTARSRNDQVTLDLRMYLREELAVIRELINELLKTIASIAEKNASVIMPGYTHLQRAQPIYFSHYILSYAMMLLRDRSRLEDTAKRMNESPIGSCALAGTTYDTNREFEAELLEFDGICKNSIDGVSDRDYVLETLSSLSIMQMHLSRMAEELVLYSSLEFGFISLGDDFTTGSSIMPQKKNPDMAELIRGKTGRVYGDLITLLVTLKGLPLAYNKDMQEDKEAVFDAIDTVKLNLEILSPMLASMKVNADKMSDACKDGFINATDLADYLVRKGMAFRDAYKVSGRIVADAEKSGLALSDYPMSAERGAAGYRSFSELFEDDVYDAVDLKNCVERRISAGGTGSASVKAQIEYVLTKINE